MKAIYKINGCLFFFVIVCLSVSCRNSSKISKKEKSTSVKNIDTTNSFKIDTFWIAPKKSLEFNSLISARGDTLDLVICAEYVYSPFGLLENQSEIKSSLLQNFVVSEKVDTSDNETTKLQSLKFKSSRLLLFFDTDKEASKESYIIKGEIFDKDVHFVNDVRIGMTKNNFYKAFFKNFPRRLQDKYKAICFESCVEGIKHIYTFKSDSLYSVEFKCVDCAWKVEY